MDYQKFFRRPAEEVAKDLIGRLLVRNAGLGSTAGRIIQTGAYEGGDETQSRAGMKYSPGRIFLMPYRGAHLLNIAADRMGYPSCVEIREVAFHDEKITGSGAIANFFGIGPDLDGILIGEEIEILGRPVDASQIKRLKGDADNSIGYYLMK